MLYHFAHRRARVHKPQRARSWSWRVTKRRHLAAHPWCAACGHSFGVTVHHITPVSVAPEREHDPANLLTLCTDRMGGRNCHLIIGHCGDWRLHNPAARAMARLHRTTSSAIAAPFLQ